VSRLARIAAIALVVMAASARAAEPRFAASVGPVPAAARAKMQGVALSPGCPVGPDELASIRLTYWGFDGAPHAGILVVHRNLAAETVTIFRELFAARFVIRRMQPYEDFAVGQYAANDDTVGFYCRPDQGDPTQFGMHSYGYAIDINPMLNPYADAKAGWWPPGSADNSSRERDAAGVVTLRSKAFAIFTRHGWLWGGLSSHGADYMHFEKATFGAHPDPRTAPYAATGLRYQAR
jgi:hypothetical protein